MTNLHRSPQYVPLLNVCIFDATVWYLWFNVYAVGWYCTESIWVVAFRIVWLSVGRFQSVDQNLSQCHLCIVGFCVWCSCDQQEPIPTDARLAFFNETCHAYGRLALLMSGGAALGFYHIGVVKALMENGLLPWVLSDASARSIMCAMIETQTDEKVLRDMVKAKGTTATGIWEC